MKYPPTVHIGPMFDKLPPESPDCEASVLYCAILEPVNFPMIRRAVTPAHFHNEHYRTVFLAMCELYDETRDINATILSDKLSSNGNAAAYEHLLAFTGTVYESTYPAHCKVLEAKFRLRKLIEICGTAIHLAYTAPDDSGATIGSTFEQIAALARNGTEARVVTQRQAFDMVLAMVESGRAANIRTGMYDFDLIAGGVPRTALWTLLGAPGGGKSTFALEVAHKLAEGLPATETHQEQPPMLVRYYSVEQGPARAGATQMSQLSGVAVHGVINTGKPSKDDLEEIRFTCKKARPSFAFIDSQMDPNQLYAECASLAAKHPHGVLFVDYLQDISGWGIYQDQTPKLTECMRIFARIVRELGWLVCVVCQTDKASGKLHQSPKMTDGLGTSAIEQRSDFITYVHRPHQKEPCPPVGAYGDTRLVDDWKARQTRTRLGIIKNKFGPLGVNEMQFVTSSMSFKTPDPHIQACWPEIKEL